MLIKTDSLGVPRFTNKDLIDMIYSGHIDKCHVVLCESSDDVDQFNDAMAAQGMPQLSKYIPLEVDQKTFDNVCQSEWFMPEEYKSLDIGVHVMSKLMEKVGTVEAYEIQEMEEYKRVCEELDAFKKYDMENLLRYMVYLVDFMRENGIVWGVGRGSSVASYVLYLIGVHRINSIQYGLDWHEFLR
jgi:DNA polymerase III alpha subunit